MASSVGYIICLSNEIEFPGQLKIGWTNTFIENTPLGQNEVVACAIKVKNPETKCTLLLYLLNQYHEFGNSFFSITAERIHYFFSLMDGEFWIHGNSASLAVVVQNPIANPAVVGAENPVVVGAENPVVVGAENPVVVGAENPVVVGAENPAVVGAENPVVVGAENPVVVGAENPDVIGTHVQAKKIPPEIVPFKRKRTPSEKNNFCQLTLERGKNKGKICGKLALKGPGEKHCPAHAQSLRVAIMEGYTERRSKRKMPL